MAEVLCNECGKVDSTVVCSGCFEDLKVRNEESERILTAAEDEIRCLKKKIEELENQIWNLENLKRED